MSALISRSDATPERRRRLAAGFLALSLATGTLGWLAGSRTMSSAESAARRRPPDASVLTATVERRVLRSEAITRGTLVRASEYSLVAWPPGDPAVGSVVTVMPLRVGTPLAEGNLAAEVGGRPVIALDGTIPAFRDLRLGDAGVDVDQLRASLARLHLIADGGAGPFDSAVVDGVNVLYGALGYLPLAGGKEAAEALLRARAQHAAAELTLRDLVAGRKEVSRSERLQAEAAVTLAKNALAIADAQTAAAVEEATRKHSAALQEVEHATSLLTVAVDRLRQAEEENRHPDTGNPPTGAELDELRQAVAEASGLLRAMADTALQRQHEMEIAALRRVAQMDAARADLELAEVRLADLGVLPPATSVQLEAARLAVSAAEKALQDAERGAAPYLPRSEVVFVPNLPRTVIKTMRRRGDSLDGPFAEVSGNDLRLDATLPSSSVASVHVGDTAVVDEVGTSISFEARLVEVSSAPVNDGADAGRFAVRLVPAGPPPDRAVGLSLRIRLPIESTDGDALIVPATALRTAVDGSVFVERYESGGIEGTPVEVLLAASGLAAVKPAGGHELAAGDKVVVGLRGAGE